jgi:hypothetical protein
LRSGAIVRAEPSDPDLQLVLANAHARLGDGLRGLGDADGALKAYQARLRILRLFKALVRWTEINGATRRFPRPAPVA